MHSQFNHFNQANQPNQIGDYYNANQNLNQGRAYNHFLQENGVIAEPKKQHQSIRYVIDSRDRNTTIYPNANNFCVDLQEKITDVTAITLINLDINLLRRYMIGEFNNGFYQGADVSPAKFTNSNVFPIGDYQISNSSLSDTHLVEVINSTGPDKVANMTAVLDSVTEKLTITTTGAIFRFNKSANGNSLAYILGFLPDVDYASGSEAPYRVNLNKQDYCVVHIENAENFWGINTPINGSFAIVRDKQSNTSYRSHDVICKEFKQPLNSLTKLRIRITDYYGDLFSLEGSETKFDFRFDTLGPV